MEIHEIEAGLEKICDLHDKLSDAIHSISRAHFLNSVKNPRNKSDEFYVHRRKKSPGDSGKGTEPGYVFVKEFRIDGDDSSVQEAKSLYAIRTALENLEDQLEFFHTVQTQQRAERDSAIARLEQSRIILAMRLSEHQGKKYKVIEEAQALVTDVRNASQFVAPEHLFNTKPNPSGNNFVSQKGKNPNFIANFFLSTFSFVSKALKLNHTGGILGNAALLAISMLAFVHLNQTGYKEKYVLRDNTTFGRMTRKVSGARGLVSDDRFSDLDVLLARG